MYTVSLYLRYKIQGHSVITTNYFVSYKTNLLVLNFNFLHHDMLTMIIKHLVFASTRPYSVLLSYTRTPVKNTAMTVLQTAFLETKEEPRFGRVLLWKVLS